MRADGGVPTVADRPGGLWRDGAFLKLWAGETISLFGSQITELALPLTAVLTLNASVLEVGLLNVARFTPFVLVSLFAGVWVDRHRRRSLLIGTNLGRAVLIGVVPIAAILGVLSMDLLYLVAFLAGVLTVLFDLGYMSYLPSLIDRRQLIDGNSKLQASVSLAGIGGPGLAGVLVGILTAPIALAVDALSYLVSAVTLLAIRKPEPEPEAATERRSVRRSIGEGLRAVFANSYLRALAGQAATFNLFENMVTTIFLVYAIDELGLSPAQLGLVIGAGSVGALAGSFLSASVGRLLGPGRTLLASGAVGCLSPALLLSVQGSGTLSSAILGVSFFLHGGGVAVCNIHALTLRQSITPDHLLGRMNASYRLLIWGAMPIGALVGGALAGPIGLRAMLAVGVVGLGCTTFWVLFSPLRRLREVPSATGPAPGQPAASSPGAPAPERAPETPKTGAREGRPAHERVAPDVGDRVRPAET